MPNSRTNRPKIAFFGHFGGGNFGNEATFQAMLWNLRRLVPDAEVMCVSTFPERVTADYKIPAIPVSAVVVKPRNVRNPVARLARKLFVGVPSEIYRWLQALKTLWHADMFVVVGTGLLTDSFCLGSWGPYSVFKWSVVAKFCRCKLLFVSTGAGPLDHPVGRMLIRSALSLADFRSYRDEATMLYLERTGFPASSDRVYPDLAFSLPQEAAPHNQQHDLHRPVVGLGLMDFDGMYGVEKTTKEQFSAYLEVLAGFVDWLLSRGYDVRLLIGDLADEPTVRDFKSLLSQLSLPRDRIIADPITSTENLLSQIAATDLVVATRFHNVLLSLFLNKPSIAISFHHKCSSLMDQMELSEYCQDIRALSAGKLIEQFCQLENHAESIRDMLTRKVEECRNALDEQYRVILESLYGSSPEDLASQRDSKQAFARVAVGREKK